MTSKAHSQAIEHFLQNTKLKRSKKRETLVEQIKVSKRPRVTARKLLDKHGANLINYKEFNDWLWDFISKKGMFDPCFTPRIRVLEQKAEDKELMKKEFEDFQKLLSKSWCPWSLDDKKESRETAKKLLEKRYEETQETKSDGERLEAT